MTVFMNVLGKAQIIAIVQQLMFFKPTQRNMKYKILIL